MLWQDVTWEIPPDETDVEMPPVGRFGITLSFRRTADIEKLAAHAGALAGKTGEALIAAILDLPDNGVTAIWREKNGQPHDGPDGEPAQVHFWDDGGLRDTAHYIDGKLHGVLGLYDRTGRLTHEDHYKDGKLTGSADVVPPKFVPPDLRYRPSM